MVRLAKAALANAQMRLFKSNQQNRSVQRFAGLQVPSVRKRHAVGI
jgi:hypothetical protein